MLSVYLLLTVLLNCQAVPLGQWKYRRQADRSGLHYRGSYTRGGSLLAPDIAQTPLVLSNTTKGFKAPSIDKSTRVPLVPNGRPDSSSGMTSTDTSGGASTNDNSSSTGWKRSSPLQFNYVAPVAGGHHSRKEKWDTSGGVTGSYKIMMDNGMFRVVEYIADEKGFRAKIKTNEPGTKSLNPADVNLESSARVGESNGSSADVGRKSINEQSVVLGGKHGGTQSPDSVVTAGETFPPFPTVSVGPDVQTTAPASSELGTSLETSSGYDHVTSPSENEVGDTSSASDVSGESQPPEVPTSAESVDGTSAPSIKGKTYVKGGKPGIVAGDSSTPSISTAAEYEPPSVDGEQMVTNASKTKPVVEESTTAQPASSVTQPVGSQSEETQSEDILHKKSTEIPSSGDITVSGTLEEENTIKEEGLETSSKDDGGETVTDVYPPVTKGETSWSMDGFQSTTGSLPPVPDVETPLAKDEGGKAVTAIYPPDTDGDASLTKEGGEEITKIHSSTLTIPEVTTLPKESSYSEDMTEQKEVSHLTTLTEILPKEAPATVTKDITTDASVSSEETTQMYSEGESHLTDIKPLDSTKDPLLEQVPYKDSTVNGHSIHEETTPSPVLVNGGWVTLDSKQTTAEGVDKHSNTPGDLSMQSESAKEISDLSHEAPSSSDSPHIYSKDGSIVTSPVVTVPSIISEPSSSENVGEEVSDSITTVVSKDQDITTNREQSESSTLSSQTDTVNGKSASAGPITPLSVTEVETPSDTGASSSEIPPIIHQSVHGEYGVTSSSLPGEVESNSSKIPESSKEEAPSSYVSSPLPEDGKVTVTMPSESVEEEVSTKSAVEEDKKGTPGVEYVSLTDFVDGGNTEISLIKDSTIPSKVVESIEPIEDEKVTYNEVTTSGDTEQKAPETSDLPSGSTEETPSSLSPEGVSSGEPCITEGESSKDCIPCPPQKAEKGKKCRKGRKRPKPKKEEGESSDDSQSDNEDSSKKKGY